MGDKCPICEAFGGLCDLLKQKSQDKGRKCWELILDMLEQKITPDDLARKLIELDPETVKEWLKNRK